MLVEQVMGERKAYPSDLTDEQWAVVGPFGYSSSEDERGAGRAA
jgi:hypothetical protein